MNLQEFRFYYPEYDHLDDEALASSIYNKHYSAKFDRREFDNRIGFEGGPPARNPQDPVPGDHSMPATATPGDQLRPEDYLALESPTEPAVPGLQIAHEPGRFKYLDKFMPAKPAHADARTRRLAGFAKEHEERMRGYDPGAGAGGAGAIAALAATPAAMVTGGIAATLRLIAEQDLNAANQTLNEVMSQPAKFVYKKQDQRLIGEVMKPFEALHKVATAAGDWAEQAAGSSAQAADVGATTATAVEFGALFGLPKLASAIGKAPWVRRLTNRERALMVQEIADMHKSGMTEGQIIRELRKQGNNKPFQDALKSRMQAEKTAATKPAPKPEGVAKGQDKKVEPAAAKEVEVLAEPGNIAAQINKVKPGHVVKYDGEYDQSAINKPTLYQFTAYEGPAKGASFSVSDPTVAAVSAKLDEMIEIREKPKPKAEEKPTIEITGKKDKTVKVDMPKAEADQLSVKEQRFYLEKEINAALKKAPKDGYSDGEITFKVPGDGEFTVVNKKSVLQEFKKAVLKTLPKSGKFAGRKIPKPVKAKGPLKNRIGGEGLEYYNEFKPRRRTQLIEQDRQWQDKDWFISTSYMLRIKNPKLKKKTLSDGIPNYKEIIAGKTIPAKIVAETNLGDKDSRPYIHIKAKRGKREELVDARFVDLVLTHHPKAGPHLKKAKVGNLIVWKTGNKVVAVTAPGAPLGGMARIPKDTTTGLKPRPVEKEKEPTAVYTDDSGRMIRVGKAPQGNYSFYRTTDLKNQGERVRMSRSEKRFFDTVEEAENALEVYAKSHGWQPQEKTKAPSGAASAGIFNEAAQEPPRRQADAAAEYIDNIPFVMQMPELISLAKELMEGRLPKVAAHISRNPSVRGFFTPIGRGAIKLKASIAQDPKQALATLAHEIGHLVDYLPQKTMKRGNLLGRMASLKKHTRRFLPHKPGAKGELTDADRKRLRQEAIKLIAGEKEPAPANLTSKDILAIWQDATGDIKTRFPDLYNYIAGLGTAEKKSIVKSAMKGLVPKELKALADRKAPHGKRKDVEAKLKDLVDAEIKKRKLFSESELRDELKTWTHFWKPFDANESAKYTKYRYSGVELYADFFSGLMLAPNTVKRYSPKSYEAFFNYLESKPKLLEEYNRIQDMIKSGDVNSKRVQDLRAMFRKGDLTWFMQYQPTASKSDVFMRDFVDQHWFLLKKIRAVGEANVPGPENPRYRIEQMEYSGSEHEYHMRQTFQRVVRPLERAGADWEDFREYVFHLRVANERAEMFNPLGHTKETSTPRIKEMEESAIGPALKKARKEFRKIHMDVVDKAEAAGIWDPKMIELMREREFYARWLVQDYVEKNNGRGPGAKVYKQYGTVSEIFDPATATIMQDLAVIKATNRSIAAKTTVDFLKKYFPKEVQEAETRWVTNHREAIPPKNKDLGQIMYLEKGKVKTYNISKYIASSFEQNPVQSMAAAKILSSMAKPFRMLFTELNYGFWMFNIHRDYFRAAKNLPKNSITRFAKYYAKGLKPAFKSAFGIPDKVIAEMAKGNMLISIADLRGMRIEDTQIERMLKQFHMKPREWNRGILRPFGKAFTYFSNVGRAFERVPKVAGYNYLREKFPDMTKEEVAHIVRTHAGSPNFLRLGRAYPIYNNLLLFSNAAKEGYRGDYRALAKSPGEYMWKTVKYHWIPKLLQYAASAGLLGIGIERVMDGVSEYDKTNYIIIPLGMTKADPETGRAGGKSVYWRIPVDETGRFMGGLLWKALNVKETGFTDGVTGIFDYMAGQAPTVNPGIDVVVDAIQYASGRNPYDSFRGREALPESVHEAGGKRAHLAMAKYIANKMGTSIIYRFQSGKIDKIQTELETILGLPIANNALGRFLKVSDYGVREDLKRAKKYAKSERMKTLMNAREAFYKLVNQEKLTKADTEALLQRPDMLSERNVTVALARKYGWMYLEEFLAAGSKEEQQAVIDVLIKKHGRQ